MRTFITGKHSIMAAIKNPKRKNLILHVKKKEDVQKYNFKGPFKINYEEKLETDEYIIYNNYEDLENNCIFLDGIEDPHNTGAIIRSAAILGYNVLIRERGCPINETVVRCASGGIDCTKIVKIKNLDNMFREMQKKNYWFIGLSHKGNVDIKSIKLQNVVIVIGSEGNGISQLVEKKCDILAHIKTFDEKMSIFNASIAASLAMYQLQDNNFNMPIL